MKFLQMILVATLFCLGAIACKSDDGPPARRGAAGGADASQTAIIALQLPQISQITATQGNVQQLLSTYNINLTTQQQECNQSARREQNQYQAGRTIQLQVNPNCNYQLVMSIGQAGGSVAGQQQGQLGGQQQGQFNGQQQALTAYYANQTPLSITAGQLVSGQTFSPQLTLVRTAAAGTAGLSAPSLSIGGNGFPQGQQDSWQQGQQTVPGQQGVRVTYNSHVRQILQNYCVSCHRPGGNASDLTSWAVVAGRTQAVVGRTLAQQNPMPPPGHPQQPNEQDKQNLRNWQQAGYPEN